MQPNIPGPIEPILPADEADDIMDFDPDLSPFLYSPLYLVPQSDSETFNVFSHYTFEEEPSDHPQPLKFDFHDLADLKTFCQNPPVDLSSYWLILPASQWHKLRVDMRRPKSRQFPCYISKLPES